MMTIRPHRTREPSRAIRPRREVSMPDAARQAPQGLRSLRGVHRDGAPAPADAPASAPYRRHSLNWACLGRVRVEASAVP